MSKFVLPEVTGAVFASKKDFKRALRAADGFLIRVRAVGVCDSGNVLCIKRVRTGRLPYLSLPGGKVEKGETMLDGLQRELAEEANATLSTKPVPLAYGRSGLKELTFLYAARIEKYSEQNRTGKEVLSGHRGQFDLVEVPTHVIAAARFPLFTKHLVLDPDLVVGAALKAVSAK